VEAGHGLLVTVHSSPAESVGVIGAIPV
jgi:hypothetical protein